MNDQIQQNITESQNIIEHIRSSINSGECNGCLQCKKIENLYNALNKLATSIKSILPIEERYIQAYLPALVGVNKVNPYDFGGIIAVMNIINARYNLTKQKKIFISHSSKDKHIVQLFVDDILQLGIGIKAEQIFCSSIEDMGIKNGEDIRKHIHDNIKCADYAFLLISTNYKASEICLNEMGAVWAFDNKVRLYLLPNTDFDSIGWLYNTRIAEKLNDPIVLDTLHEEMKQYYSLQDKPINSWSRQRQKFISEIKLVEK